MNTPLSATHVFFSPSNNSVIDTCTDEKPPRSHVMGQTLEELQARYPDAVIMPWKQASQIMQERHKKPVSEITEQEWWDMLEVLPPQGWRRTGEGESFKMSERWSGNITSIYARITDEGKDRFFTLRDDFTLSHDKICAACWRYIEAKEDKK